MQNLPLVQTPCQIRRTRSVLRTVSPQTFVRSCLGRHRIQDELIAYPRMEAITVNTAVELRKAVARASLAVEFAKRRKFSSSFSTALVPDVESVAPTAVIDNSSATKKQRIETMVPPC